MMKKEKAKKSTEGTRTKIIFPVRFQGKTEIHQRVKYNERIVSEMNAVLEEA